MSKHVHYKFSVEISVSSPEFIAGIGVFPLHTAARCVPSILYTGYIPVRGCDIQGGFVECPINSIAAIFSWLLLMGTAMVEIISKYVNNRHCYEGFYQYHYCQQ